MKYIAASDASKKAIWLHQLLIQIDSFSKHGLVIEIFYASRSNGYRLCYLEQTLINVKPRNKLSSTLLTYLSLCSIPLCSHTCIFLLLIFHRERYYKKAKDISIIISLSNWRVWVTSLKMGYSKSYTIVCIVNFLYIVCRKCHTSCT